MKYKRLWQGLCVWMVCLLVAGCGAGAQDPEASATPAQDTAHKEYQNYLTMTKLTYPAGWEPKDADDQESQLTTRFTIKGGTAAIQFLFLTPEQAQSNVDLQQLDLDDVAQEQAKAGPYEGLVLSGKDGTDKICTFEGSRAWYDTGTQCVMRVYINSTTADSDDLYETMMDILESTTVYEEKAAEITQWAEQDFTEEYGLKLSMPSEWYVNPEYYPEEPGIVLQFEVAQGGNVVTVEYGTTDKSGYNELLEYTRTFIETGGVVGGTIAEKGNTVTAEGLYEGRKTYTKIEKKQTAGGKIKYLQVSYQLRPDLESAYKQAFETMVQSIRVQ